MMAFAIRKAIWIALGLALFCLMLYASNFFTAEFLTRY
jgi:hypothetical protein